MKTSSGNYTFPAHACSYWHTSDRSVIIYMKLRGVLNIFIAFTFIICMSTVDPKVPNVYLFCSTIFSSVLKGKAAFSMARKATRLPLYVAPIITTFSQKNATMKRWEPNEGRFSLAGAFKQYMYIYTRVHKHDKTELYYNFLFFCRF